MKRECSDVVCGRAAVGAFARPVEMEVWYEIEREHGD
jgi:hypothetical protein